MKTQRMYNLIYRYDGQTKERSACIMAFTFEQACSILKERCNGAKLFVALQSAY